MAQATDNRTETDPAVIAARLRSVEAHLASAPVHELDNLADDVGRVQSWLAAYLAKLTARADAARPQGGDARRTAARTGIGSREATKAAKRGEAMARMPDAMNALKDGEIGVGHADVMAAQSDRLSGDQRRAFEDQAADMVRDAVENDESVHAFGLRCRELADRLLAEEGIRQEHERRRRASKASWWVDPVDGMTKLYGHWDPVRGEAIRRLACEAGMLPIVLDGKGQALDVGRERRLATKAQRPALRAMYPTCGMEPDGTWRLEPPQRPPP